jgi:hypothetical protein
MPKDARTKTARALRVYEYVDDDGIVYYSFTYLPGRTIRRLTLVEPRGTHFRSHISDIHQLALHRELLEEQE